MAEQIGVQNDDATETIEAMFQRLCRDGGMEMYHGESDEVAPMDDLTQLLKQFEGIREVSDVDQPYLLECKRTWERRNVPVYSRAEKKT
ncbi:hypothetical protein FRX31_024043 [Thalictrum thalictroides]|uniref:Uncharacterized protein n=1 Tax=Thalictrum thalictroides TaxID=46969 RepID=A0A7J6VP80_THATH|nr:hypothetical protein FRX31_024043 [Thalictrum thalictroides]